MSADETFAVDDSRLDTLLLVACRERGITSAADLRCELRDRVTAQHGTSDDRARRVNAAIVRLGMHESEQTSVWRDATQRYGVDSGPARGALLDIVREVWADPYASLRYEDAGVIGAEEGWYFDLSVWGATELDALVAALETRT
jgi:hypothetical protein